MRNITYKYKIGDIVRFKEHFHPTASCGLKALAGTTAKVIKTVDYGKPTYCLEGFDGCVFAEACFAGLATVSVDTPQGTIVCKVVTNQGPVTKCDTEGFKEA